MGTRSDLDIRKAILMTNFLGWIADKTRTRVRRQRHQATVVDEALMSF